MYLNKNALVLISALVSLMQLSAADIKDIDLLRKKIETIAAPFTSARDFMGVVAVKYDTGPPLMVATGESSIELQTAHKQNDIFMIGSISKQFTAAAILLLEEDGRLSTGDLLHKHLPGFAHGHKITIEQLLTHTSGVADVYSLKRFGLTAGQEGTFTQVISDLSDMDLTFIPGTGYAYSNGGYSVLAAIIEKVSGMEYGEYLAKRIFIPLGMKSTSHDTPGPAVSGRVPGYDPWGFDNLTPVKPIAEAYSKGSGSIWSSAADLLKWNSKLHNNGFLNESSYGKFITDHGNAYGYGVSIFKRFARRAIGHDGRVAGYASDLVYYPDENLSIVVLSNVQSVARDDIRHLVAAAVFGEDYDIPERRIFQLPDDKSLSQYAGIYSFGPGFNVSIRESSGRLMARANEGGSSELVPLNENEWFSRMLYATVRFARDDSGKVDRLIWGRGASAPVGRRTE